MIMAMWPIEHGATYRADVISASSAANVWVFGGTVDGTTRVVVVERQQVGQLPLPP
jgi:hypothetical protein